MGGQGKGRMQVGGAEALGAGSEEFDVFEHHRKRPQVGPAFDSWDLVRQVSISLRKLNGSC